MESDDEQLDAAMAERLAKLRDMPVDLSGVRKRLDAELQAGPTGVPRMWWRRLPVILIAASVAVVALLLAVVLVSNNRPHRVTAGELAVIDTEMASGGRSTPVSTTDEANRVLRTQWPVVPMVTQVDRPVKSCCVHKLRGKRVACLSLDPQGEPILMLFGHSSEVRLPDWAVATQEGFTCRCYTAPGERGGINAACFERGGVSVFVFGRHPLVELIHVASRVGVQTRKVGALAVVTTRDRPKSTEAPTRSRLGESLSAGPGILYETHM